MGSQLGFANDNVGAADYGWHESVIKDDILADVHTKVLAAGDWEKTSSVEPSRYQVPKSTKWLRNPLRVSCVGQRVQLAEYLINDWFPRRGCARGVYEASARLRTVRSERKACGGAAEISEKIGHVGNGLAPQRRKIKLT